MDQIREQVLTFPRRGTRGKPMAEVALSLDKIPTTEVSVSEQDTLAFRIFHGRSAMQQLATTYEDARAQTAVHSARLSLL